MHIHLDPVGGIAGDMFIAAIVDALPECRVLVEEALRQFTHQASATFSAKTDGILCGTGFSCRRAVASVPSNGQDSVGSTDSHGHDSAHSYEHGAAHSHEHGAAHSHEHDSAHPHGHNTEETHEHHSYSEIRQLLIGASLAAAVRHHALEIFALIGEAEAQVHGTPLADIQFHEVGGWDSIVDVVAAACIIEQLKGSSWSYSSLPVGGGFVRTAHGLLPVPVPATAVLLKGFKFRDDGVLGERVTPTGAAILKYLQPVLRLPSNTVQLQTVGHGFGTSRFPNLSNVLRAVIYTQTAIQPSAEHISSLAFEIDDMTGEELAISLDELRNAPGVLDITQSTVYGKKNRIMMSVQVLVKTEYTERVVDKILNSTTTLGVRHQEVQRFILPRSIKQVSVEDRSVRVKMTQRPDGRQTSKADVDDLANSSTNCFDLREEADKVQNAISQGEYE